MLTFLTVFLWLHASCFDETEHKTILYMALAAGGWEALKGKIEKLEKELQKAQKKEAGKNPAKKAASKK